MMRVIGLGAGGHAKVLIDALGLCGDVEIVGLTDKDRERWSSHVLGVPILGDDSILGRLRTEGVEGAFIAVGSVGDATARRMLYDTAVRAGFSMIRIIHPASVVAASAEVGPGTVLLAGAVVNADARVGDNTIVNTTAVVEHDCVIGHHVHIATGAKLASTVTVGEGAHIGAGAVVRQCVTVGPRAVVGAGAVVVEDVEPGVTVVGVPARPLRRSHEARR